MQALILAAGYGKRLRPLTDSIHKSLVEVNGRPLLVNALDCLSGRDIHEVIIVVGDKKDQVIKKIGHSYCNMKITYVENPLFHQTNNIYSLWLAKPYIHEDLIMLECDLFYSRSLIDLITTSTASCNILVSPFNPSAMDGTIVHVTNNMNIDALIIKRDQEDSPYKFDLYKTVNIYKFSKDFITVKFLPFIDTYIKTQNVNSYYELVLGSLIFYKNDDIKAVIIDSTEWCEIDNIDDLNEANKKFNR